jgi:peptidyl-prolyl cis-trans isomerase D
MFDFIRNHTRLTLGFLLLLIIPSFVFFGVEGYSKFTDGTGTDRGQGRWPCDHAGRVGRAAQAQRRPHAPRAARPRHAHVRTPEMRKDTLEGIVRERVLIAAANKLHLTPSDARLQRLFVSDPQFAPCATPTAASTATSWPRRA